jgi:carbamoyltransferase
LNILGLSAFYHDSAATIVSDGSVVAAAQQERFSRIKHDPGYPAEAITACLQAAGLRASDIDLVAFYEKPLLKIDRVFETVAAVAPRGLRRWSDALPSWFTEKLRVEDRVREQLGFTGKVIFASHHESHAASAFFVSPFEEAATLTMDGVGEWTTNAIGFGRGRRLQLLQDLRFPHSLGLLYSAFTQYLGFAVNEGEYKVMGLAPYGEPRFVDLILAHLIDLAADGSYTLHLDYFDFLWGDSTISPRFEELFGRATRAPNAPLEAFHADVARSIQAVTEAVVLAQARYARDLTGARNLCLAGGVALNSVANGKLLTAGLFDDLYVQPAAGDAGGSLGAALVAWHHVLGNERGPLRDGMSGAALGPAPTTAEIEAALVETNLTAEVLAPEALSERVAGLLADGAVVGWLQGRMEFGPRALGHRSILADPRRLDMQSRVNQKIKFREGFRPFAPSIPLEEAGAWFQLERPSPYMLLVVPIATWHRKPLSPEDAAKTGFDRLWIDRSTIPAVTHVDGSARVQTVTHEDHPAFYALLRAFQARTGCPILLNTSFNLKDEPVVASPLDACRTFLASGMDALVLEDRLVLRPADRAPTGRLPERVAPPREVTDAHLRTFGVGGGAILGTLAALQLALGNAAIAVVLLCAAALLAAPGFQSPRALEGVEAVFFRVGRVIGRFNARVLLSLIYLLVVTPIAAARRAALGDPLTDRRDPVGGGKWRVMDHDPDDAARYDRMFR